MRDSTVQQAEKIAGGISRTIVGLVFMAGGGGLVWYQLEHPPHSDKLIIAAGSLSIFGALIMPSVLPVFQQIVATVAPFLPWTKKAAP